MTALPTRKLEAFRYTDLRALAALSFSEPLPATLPTLPDLGLPRAVFSNGVFMPDLSDALPHAKPFAPVDETSDLALARINAEHATDGLTLDIPAGVDVGAVVLISHISNASPIAVHARHRIRLGAGARLTIIEISMGEGIYWNNPVTDIVLGEGANLGYFRMQTESLDAFHLATIRADVADRAVFESVTAVIGARLSRTESHVALGEASHTHLNAAQLLRGSQHGDITTVVHHRAPHATSRQTIKSVLGGTARGVFQGRIEVDRPAQKTDGYQMNQALLLSRGAEMDIKPELQIFADDVKCSHGATIGALDPEQLFYLRSRGIREPQARALLIRAFVEDALEPMTLPPARALFEAAFDTWWEAA
jgi:Fe-S cluster assembly protein SufD